MLSFNQVTKRFGKITAVEDITFSVPEGDFLLITGPSGAGKTTILKLLLREFPPTNGEIIFDEIAVHKLKTSAVPSLRRKIGAVFQDFKLLPTLTVAENIEFPLEVRGVPKKEWKERAQHVSSLVGVSDRLSLFPNQLSGGELQRVAIARALITNPKLIFADEPTGNLDIETAMGIWDLLNRIHKEGKTIIVTTHNKEIIDSHKGAILKMRNGKIDLEQIKHKEKK